MIDGCQPPPCLNAGVPWGDTVSKAEIRDLYEARGRAEWNVCPFQVRESRHGPVSFAGRWGPVGATGVRLPRGLDR